MEQKHAGSEVEPCPWTLKCAKLLYQPLKGKDKTQEHTIKLTLPVLSCECLLSHWFQATFIWWQELLRANHKTTQPLPMYILWKNKSICSMNCWLRKTGNVISLAHTYKYTHMHTQRDTKIETGRLFSLQAQWSCSYSNKLCILNILLFTAAVC